MNSSKTQIIQFLWEVSIGDEIQPVFGQGLLLSLFAKLQHHVDLILPPCIGEPWIGKLGFQRVNIPRGQVIAWEVVGLNVIRSDAKVSGGRGSKVF